MPKYTIRFADFATRDALFELQVEQDTTVGALKSMAEDYLSNSDDLCPMQYYDKWYLEVQVGKRKRLMGIDEGDDGLTLAAAGLEDESFVYLEGPKFEEGQAEVGRAIAAVRSQAKAQTAQHALQVQSLIAEMGRRLDAMAAKQKDLSEAQSGKQSEAIYEKLDAMAVKQQETINEALDKALKQQAKASGEQFEVTSRKFQKQLQSVLLLVVIGVAIFFCASEWNGLQQLKDLIGMQPMKQHKAEVDSLLQKHSNRPLAALWEVLNDKANTDIELPMAVIKDRRCGIRLRAELADGPMKSKWITFNAIDYEGATR